METKYTAEDYLVVMPSIRPINAEYLTALKGFDIFVCDDSDGAIDRSYITDQKFKDDNFKSIVLGGRVFRESFIPKGKEHLFPRHCPSVKDLGLYYAWKEGYSAVILIDDDVDTSMVSPEKFLTIGNPMTTTTFWTKSEWFNTLRLLGHSDIYARGYPYEYRGEEYKWFGETNVITSYFNEGLWTGTPDINGIDKLEMCKEYAYPNFQEQTTELAQKPKFDDSNMPWYIKKAKIHQNMVLKKRQKLPLSIMNCQIDTSLIPAFWQPPDYLMYRTFKIRRHDDVWSMYFLKKVMDILGLSATVGNPVLWHRKAGDPIGEVLSEHHTNLIQHRLTDLLDDKYYVPNPGTPAQVAASLASACLGEIETYTDNFDRILQSYFASAQEWAELFMV